MNVSYCDGFRLGLVVASVFVVCFELVCFVNECCCLFWLVVWLVVCFFGCLLGFEWLFINLIWVLVWMLSVCVYCLLLFCV